MARVQQRDILMKELELALVCRIVSMPLSRSLVFRSSSICRGPGSAAHWSEGGTAPHLFGSPHPERLKKNSAVRWLHYFKSNYFDFILRGCWMLESDWLTNVLSVHIFREMQDECSSSSSLDRITVLYHFAKLFLLFHRSYNRKITKTHHDTGQTNQYSKQSIKSSNLVHVFCHKLRFITYGKHIAYSLSLSRSRLSFTDTHI